MTRYVTFEMIGFFFQLIVAGDVCFCDNGD